MLKTGLTCFECQRRQSYICVVIVHTAGNR